MRKIFSGKWSVVSGKWKMFFLALFTCHLSLFMTGCSEIKEVKADVLPPPDPIEEKLNSMTLEEKIGQMIMIGVYGNELNDDIIYSLNQFHFGGVIFFDRNLESVAQAKKFANDIEAAANQKAPLFFAIDEEGGRVARGKHFLEVAPSQEEIGYSGNPELAKYWAKHNSNILRSIGVNINFAPVADVGSNDTRSFGSDAQIVAEFVNASAQGYDENNFLYTLKHFPGIGKSKIDPHKEISNIEDSRAVLDAEDLPPFKKIIREHDNSRFMVMVGHLKYDSIDPINSASLSPAVMTGLLRNELGFSGVVITDDLEMGAIKNNVDLSTLGIKMILAGGDIALVCHDYASQQTVYNSILAAVKRSEISEERINESVRRILKMKAHLQ
ncbi:MAG: glycoside hydrolase family 3 protein [Selenomonadaceae bacterium]|nr:glycoside hydrolase family 3 protein [Selenomonadaceae bacterium]